MHFRHVEEFNKACSNTMLYVNFCLAWLFTAGLFHIAMVIMTHVNSGICKLLFHLTKSHSVDTFTYYSYSVYSYNQCIHYNVRYDAYHTVTGWDPIIAHNMELGVSYPHEDGSIMPKHIRVLIIVVGCILIKCICFWIHWQLILCLLQPLSTPFCDSYRAKFVC